ncbi:hypothetical protein CPT_LL12_115 [Escherichia phage LL12]|uniref:Uncharacterized protein n=1 Tax=Escherichia phage LL12 TaxID=2233993 RepID=A0A2Z5HSK7_9CAUD|nr:hypothetical protein CPT_LL12_115 [Escherichia phage LL12]
MRKSIKKIKIRLLVLKRKYKKLYGFIKWTFIGLS